MTDEVFALEVFQYRPEASTIYKVGTMDEVQIVCEFLILDFRTLCPEVQDFAHGELVDTCVTEPFNRRIPISISYSAFYHFPREAKSKQ